MKGTRLARAIMRVLRQSIASAEAALVTGLTDNFKLSSAS
jgi:hypothetical protein